MRNLLATLGILMILTFGEPVVSEDVQLKGHAEFMSTKSTRNDGISVDGGDSPAQAAHCRRNNSAKKIVVCYFRGGYSNFQVSEIDPCLCTHVVFSSVVISEHGLPTSPKENSQLKSLVTLKETNPSLMVLAGVVGIEPALSGSSAANVTSLADMLANFVQQHQLNGVDIWWNYQTADVKQSAEYLSHSSDLLTKFTKDLKTKMKRFPSTPVLSVTLAKDVHFLLNGYNFSSITDDVDFFNFPSFQFTKSKSSIAGHPSRLQGAADMDNVDSFVDLLISLEIPRTKIVIGIPTFGSAYLLNDSQQSSAGSPVRELRKEHGVNSYPQILSYPQVCNMMKVGNWDVHRDVDDSSPYVNRGVHWIGFEDRISIKTKTKFILLRNLAGVSVWTINDDDHKNVCKQGSLPLLRSAHDMLIALESPLDAFHDTNITLDSDESQELRVVEREGLIQRLDSSNTDPQTLMRFQCTRSGYFRDPKDCTKFYRCAKYGGKSSGESVVFLYDCPHGLVFDEKDEICNWPPWSSPCEGSGEVMPVPQRTFVCPSTGYYQDPENCRWFFFCADFGDGEPKAFEFRCPSALLGFDQHKVMCNWKWLVAGCSLVSPDRTGGSRSAENRSGSFPRKAVYVSRESMDNEFYPRTNTNRSGNTQRSKATSFRSVQLETFPVRENYRTHRLPASNAQIPFTSDREGKITPTDRYEVKYDDETYGDDFGYTYSSKVSSHTYIDRDRSFSSSNVLPQKVESIGIAPNSYHPERHQEAQLNGRFRANKEISFSGESSAEKNVESLLIRLAKKETRTSGKIFEDFNFSSPEKITNDPSSISKTGGGPTPQRSDRRIEMDPARPRRVEGTNANNHMFWHEFSKPTGNHGDGKISPHQALSVNKIQIRTNVDGKDMLGRVDGQRQFQAQLASSRNTQPQTVLSQRTSAWNEKNLQNVPHRKVESHDVPQDNGNVPFDNSNVPFDNSNVPFEMVLEAVLTLGNDEKVGVVNRNKLSNLSLRENRNKISNRFDSPGLDKIKNSDSLDSEKDRMQCISEVSLVISEKGNRGNFPEKFVLKKSQLKRTGPNADAKALVSDGDGRLSKSQIFSEDVDNAKILTAKNSENLLLSDKNREDEIESDDRYSEKNKNPLTNEFSFSFINSTYIGDFSLPPRDQQKNDEDSEEHEISVRRVTVSSNFDTGDSDFSERGKSLSASSRSNTAVNSNEEVVEVYDEVPKKFSEKEGPREYNSSAINPNVSLTYERLPLSESSEDKPNRNFFSTSTTSNVNSQKERVSSPRIYLTEGRNATSMGLEELLLLTPKSFSGKESIGANLEVAKSSTVNSDARRKPNPTEILHLADKRSQYNSTAPQTERIFVRSGISSKNPVKYPRSGILLEVEHVQTDRMHYDVLYEVYEREMKSERANSGNGMKKQANASFFTGRNGNISESQPRNVPGRDMGEVVFDQRPKFQGKSSSEGTVQHDQDGRNSSDRILVSKNVTAELKINTMLSTSKNQQSSVVYAEQIAHQIAGDVDSSSNTEHQKSDFAIGEKLRLQNLTSSTKNGGIHAGNANTSQNARDFPKAEHESENHSDFEVSSHVNDKSSESLKTDEKGITERHSQKNPTERPALYYDENVQSPQKEKKDENLHDRVNVLYPSSNGFGLQDSQNERIASVRNSLKFGERLKPLLDRTINRNVPDAVNQRYPYQGSPSQGALAAARNQNEFRLPTVNDYNPGITINENSTNNYHTYRSSNRNTGNQYNREYGSAGVDPYSRNARNQQSDGISNTTGTNLGRSDQNTTQRWQRTRNTSRRRTPVHNKNPDDNHFFSSRTEGELQNALTLNYTREPKRNSETFVRNSKHTSIANDLKDPKTDRYLVNSSLASGYSATERLKARTTSAGSQATQSTTRSRDILDETFAGPLRRYVFPISPGAFKYPLRNDLYTSNQRNSSQTALDKTRINFLNKSVEHNREYNGTDTSVSSRLFSPSQMDGGRQTHNLGRSFDSDGHSRHFQNNGQLSNPSQTDGGAAGQQIHSLGRSFVSDTHSRHFESNRPNSGHVHFDYSDGDKLNAYLRIGTFLIFPSDDYDRHGPRRINSGHPRRIGTSPLGEQQVSYRANASSPRNAGSVDQKNLQADEKDTSVSLSRNDLDKSRSLLTDDKTGITIPGVACTRAGLFYHPDDCNKFYQCYWDRWLQKFTLHIFKCPVKLVFDDRIFGCSYPEWEAPCLNTVKSESDESKIV